MHPKYYDALIEKRRRRTMIRLGALFLVIVVGTGIFAYTRDDDSAPDPDTAGTVATVPPTTVPTTTLGASDRLSLDVATDLRDGQEVMVTGRGFVANGPVGVVQCTDANTPSSTAACDIETLMLADADADGGFVAEFSTRRTLYADYTNIDCASAASGCYLGAWSIADNTLSGSAQLTFDASAPNGDTPTITALPTEDLVDGAVLLVGGSGFAPNEAITVALCVTGIDETSWIAGGNNPNCFAPTVTTQATTGETGDFLFEWTSSRFVPTAGETVDCANPGVGTCVLLARLDNPPQNDSSGRVTDPLVVTFSEEALAEDDG